jgi:hypothetical protein
MLGWPHALGLLVAVFSFIAIFSLLRRTVFSKATVFVMVILMASAIYMTGGAGAELLLFAGLGLAANAYLQTFATVAYDIRKAGTVTLRRQDEARSRHQGG